jgi:hypothetical protein
MEHESRMASTIARRLSTLSSFYKYCRANRSSASTWKLQKTATKRWSPPNNGPRPPQRAPIPPTAEVLVAVTTRAVRCLARPARLVPGLAS